MLDHSPLAPEERRKKLATLEAQFGHGVVEKLKPGAYPFEVVKRIAVGVYNDGFVNLNLGSSAAQSVILMAIVIGLTAFQFRFVERRVHYG